MLASLRPTPGMRSLAGGVLFLLGCAGPALADCATLQRDFQAALASSNLEAVARTVTALREEPDCSGPAAAARRQAANAHLRAAEREGSPARRLEILTAGSRFQRTWQVMSRIGDLRRERREFAEASIAYEAALTDIEQLPRDETVPEGDFRRLVDLTGEMRLAAPSFVPTRALTRSFRNISISAAPLPVRFHYDSNEMTEPGRQYAEEALRLLTVAGRPRIRLIGHTDPIGSDEYNLGLSERRAAAFREFLVRRGYDPSAIETEGRGKRELFQPQPGLEYSQEQLYEMHRRVVVVVLPR